MSEQEKPMPRFWQIHLDTAIVLMFVTSGILGANIVGHRGEFVICLEDGTASKFPATPTVKHLYGWPFPFQESLPKADFDRLNADWLGEDIYGIFAVGFDLVIWLFILVAALGFYEINFRHREGRKP